MRIAKLMMNDTDKNNDTDANLLKLLNEAWETLEGQIGEDPLNSYDSFEEMYEDYPLIKVFHKLSAARDLANTIAPTEEINKGIPFKPGLYKYKCFESDGEWQPAAVIIKRGMVIACTEDLGRYEINVMSDNLTDIVWESVA